MTREIYGVTFNGKHSWKDYGLKWMAPFVIESPKEKRYSVEIPARNGKLDLTKFLTGDDVQYENRTMGFAFEYEGDYTKWDIVADKIENDLHGQLCGIIPDNRPDFVYYGVVTVNTKKETLESSCEIEILVDAEPYKYERYGSLEPWVWDTFCFEDGIIRDYRDLEVNGTMVLMIPGRRKKVVPVFECSESMVLEYHSISYTLPKGKSKVMDLQLGAGEHILTFQGEGTVSVDYRGASL